MKLTWGHSVAEFIADRIFPLFCVGCDTEGVWVCNPCEQKLTFSIPIWNAALAPLQGLTSVYTYDQKIVADIIKALKYDYASTTMRWIDPAIGKWLDEGGAGLFEPGSVLVPVPLHKRRFAQRGFNQAELMAKSLSQHLELPVASLLTRNRRTKPQAQKNRLERLTAVKEAFLINEAVRINKQNRVILIDDVSTTGATLAACAQTLKGAGFKKVYGLCFAREI